ncbi:cilia- and flagella-associated protein 251-like isoform X4 [Choristoneura fumiferana]|uniref:cilia- and flagella-associated protein 251-like isoform X4 n=1 Tax=Choristoneura fumiferana TaxID=7141 RepID=UPI003D15940C
MSKGSMSKLQASLEKFHSLPNVRRSTGSEADVGRLYSTSLSQIRKHAVLTDYNHKPSPFNLRWISGYNPKAGVINLNDKGSTTVFYAASNCGILYNWTTNQMRILQGHKVFVIERGLLKETDDYELKIRKPEKNINPEYGRLTCFTFVSDTSQVLVATNKGAVLVYGYTTEYQKNIEPKSFELLKFVKVLKVEDTRINVIKNIDGVVVTGNNSGEIRFYDDQLKLLYWVHGFSVDSVRGLSFNVSPRSYKIFDPKCKSPKKCLCWEKVIPEVDPMSGTVRQKLIKKKLPTDATTCGKPFIVRDFIVCTHNQGIAFVDFVTEKLVTILDYKISPAMALTVHPEKPYVCTGFADGVIDLVNFVQHKLFARLELRDHYKIVIPPKDDSIKCNYEVTIPELSVSCLKYSPSGLHLACGLNTGQLLFLDPVTIKILTKPPFKDTDHAIKEMNFSRDSLTLAFSDVGRTVCVYKYDCEHFVWSFIGKHRAHYKDITAVLFTPMKNNDGEYKLLSLGADRIMVEYNIGESSEEYLEIFSLDRMDQTAIPLTAILWPTPKNLDPKEFRTDLPMILVANDENKYKIVNYSTTMTLATVLGPRYESPVCKMQLISRTEDGEKFEYLVFATKNVIGLQKMPLDGNPWKHVGLLGHPIQIHEMCYREDSGTLFTIGAKDTCLCQWATNFRSVETTTKQGGGDLDPYYCLIEDGRPGWLFQEIRDLFYYIQILCQGTFSPAMRRVKDFIPIDSLPDLMRALGFFPSEYEVENLIIEARHKVYQQEPSSEIDFEEFVRLYVNHRPAFGDSFARLRNAFRTFASLDKETYSMQRDDFVEMLENYGECFSRSLSWYLLSILSGHSFDDRGNMTEGDFSFLPENITLNELVSNIMGIGDVDALAEQYSVMDSIGSSQLSSYASDDKEKNN